MSSRRTDLRQPLVDSFERTVHDLRISVTDKCNFRCRYCMPPQGLPWLPKDELLSFEEIARVTTVLVECGVRSLKLTGGEPLVRRDLPKLVQALRAIDDELDISLTTNGYLLGDLADELAGAGLDRVTVSCDSLLTHRFAEITLRDAFHQVMEGLRAAAAAGLTPIKINTVVMKGINHDEIDRFAELARDTGWEVRFIEYMPLDAQGEWDKERVVAGRDIIAQIDEAFPLSGSAEDGPATKFTFADGNPGSVSIIPSVSEPFCDSCDRLRLTADGQLRACLFSLDEYDVRAVLRDGGDDDAIEDVARRCVASKWAGHKIGRPDFVAPSRSMSMIGG